MTASVLFSISIVFAAWGLYHILGYRVEKKKWRSTAQANFGLDQDRKSFMVIWGDRFDSTHHGKKMSAKLKLMNLPIMASEFYSMLVVGGMLTTIALNHFAGIVSPYNIVMSAAVMASTPKILFFFRRNKFEDRLADQLPEACQTLANAIRSGMTITQGLQIAASDLDQPLKGEFDRVIQEINVGVDFDQAFTNFQKRTRLFEYKLFVITLLTQKKVGGNLHAALENMAATLEERKLLKQETKTLTAEQRYVAYIVPCIPLIMVLMMNNMQEGFIEPLFSGIGLILFLIFLGGTLLSIVLIKKVTNFKV